MYMCVVVVVGLESVRMKKLGAEKKCQKAKNKNVVSLVIQIGRPDWVLLQNECSFNCGGDKNPVQS